jgi:lipopolysaccharide export system permease protein
MLFHSSIRKELARTFGATLVVLITIVMTIILIRTLGQASRGVVNPSEVMMVMGFSVLGYLPVLLTLSLFIAIVGTLSRMYAESEMVIWHSSGRGLAGFISPLWWFAWPVLIAITVLALLIWPWTNQQVLELKVRYEKRGNIERVAPGRFQESADGSRVFFIDKESADNKSGSNVFIASSLNGKISVTSARSGRIEFVNGERFLLLDNGQRLDSPATGTLEKKLSQFESYGIRVPDDVLATEYAAPAKAVPTLTLLREPTRANKAELAWRIGLALAAVNLVLIAVTVPGISPRSGRGGNLVLALLTFVVYYNLISLGQTWIAGGRIGMGAYLLILHGGAFALAVGWIASRHQNWSLAALWRPRSRNAAAVSS